MINVNVSEQNNMRQVSQTPKSNLLTGGGYLKNNYFLYIYIYIIALLLSDLKFK